MVNPRLAARYAKSLIDLAIERNELDTIYKDMLFMQSVCRGSRDFVNLLKSPVIPSEKKDKILTAITAGRLSAVVSTFNKLLIQKNREAFLPEIVTAFIQQYKDYMGICLATLTTATPASEELKKTIIDKIKTSTAIKHIELNTVVKEGIIGGFILEVGDLLVDASIAFDLSKIKKQFQNNDFIYKIR
jgi:F-type H+-transporting ATPase subunit delta